MAKVSILMNGYNSEEYLKEAIDSVYSQTFTNWEIVFIDNCSTDNTKAIVDSYDNKIKYYKTDENIPLGAARNFGIKFCTSEYLAFLDTDDIWLNDKLEKQVNIMDENQEYKLCYGGVIYIDKLGEKIGRLIPKALSGNVFGEQLNRYEINIQSVLIRKDIEININETLRHSPDFDLFMGIVSKYKIFVIKDYIVKVRKLEDSLTSKNIDVWWQEMKYTLDKILLENSKLIKEYPKEFKMAYAKVTYYKSQYLISIGKKKDANKELYKIKFLSKTYFFLYTVSLFPEIAWNFAHKYFK